MNPILLMLIEELAKTVGPPLARLIVAGIESLIAELTPTANAPLPAAGTVAEIIKGIDHDHPDWSGEKKRQWVADAVAQFITNHGGEPSRRAVDTLVQLGVQAVVGGGVEPGDLYSADDAGKAPPTGA